MPNTERQMRTRRLRLQCVTVRHVILSQNWLLPFVLRRYFLDQKLTTINAENGNLPDPVYRKQLAQALAQL